MTRADIGIAIGAGTDVAIDSADVILVKSNPNDIMHFLNLAHATSRKMTQNLWWGAGYNILAIPLAGGLFAAWGLILSPAIGAILMSLSTIVVAINAMTLKLKKLSKLVNPFLNLVRLILIRARERKNCAQLAYTTYSWYTPFLMSNTLYIVAWHLEFVYDGDSDFFKETGAMLEIREEQDPKMDLEIKVVKRDGRILPFSADKIEQAVIKAAKNVKDELEPLDYQILNSVATDVVSEVGARFDKDVKIYEIQNIVEHKLLEHHQYDIAQEYINYRTQRDFARNKATDINFTIQKLLAKDQTVVNENANKDSQVFNTQRDLTAGTVAKAMGLKMLPPKVANAHLKGEIHWHDLDYQPYSPMTNCCLIDFKEMLNHGFKIGNAEVEAPHSIQTATAQMSQIIANVASSQYGGCSADRVDELLAPFAQKNYDKHLTDAKNWIDGEAKQTAYAQTKTEKDIYDAMQALEYEINTLYSSQGQTPFTTLGFGLGTSWMERAIQKAILEIRIEGLGKEKRTAIFPKLVFAVKRGLNLAPTDPNYDIKQLAVECATKRMYLTF